MHGSLNRNVFLIKEHVGMFKAASNYDVFDPDTGELILQCREPRLGPITRLLRFTEWKLLTPFEVVVTTPAGDSVLTVKRGIPFPRSIVSVFDDEERYLGGFKQAWFSIFGRFSVHGADGQDLCTVKGKWTTWEFSFMAGEREIAKVSKKFAGVMKELFTSADNYVLTIDDSIPMDHPARQLIVAAVFCIDMVLKEG
jgi:uncharacterized protein YxjI